MSTLSIVTLGMLSPVGGDGNGLPRPVLPMGATLKDQKVTVLANDKVLEVSVAKRVPISTYPADKLAFFKVK